MSRREPSFRQLLSYLTGKGTVPSARFVLNLHSSASNLRSIAGEFEANARFLPPRKNGIYLYHEVLALAASDRHLVNPALLLDLAAHYLQRRAPTALAFAQVHLDTGSPHVHLLISSNAVGSSRKIRLSRPDFAQIQRETETYQREKYPALIHSIAFGDKTKATPLVAKSIGESQRRLQKQGLIPLSKKVSLAEKIRQILPDCFSLAEFQNELAKLGYVLYWRGESAGVLEQSSGRKHRLQSLQLADLYAEKARQWAKDLPRQQALQKIHQDKAQEFWQKQGLTSRITDIYQELRQNPQSPPHAISHTQLLTEERELVANTFDIPFPNLAGNGMGTMER